ncbi:MAG: nuclear transport factor 2 family protein [Deltaproteobacteria bacterium]|nr:nuclear transport factor 2 family protein [Deltaproteobacteria bacterium]
MSVRELTAKEKRNIELVKDWAKIWDADGGRMVDECYAASAEVFGPLQNIYFLRKGESKVTWRALEAAIHALYQSRKMHFHTLVAEGNTVAMEVIVEETNLKGRKREVWFSAFLTFDDDGKIVKDHTYQLNMEKTPDPEKAKDPKIKEAMETLREIHSRILAQQ